ncbi:hypothetical protein ACFVXE_15745 [Streptomyces sp. NPDC058231]|uniref:hypothetical protein n=1 Tax=Streptomyces sp. NPDC058231 TaxID=3346392 RepID=UPI0036EC077E
MAAREADHRFRGHGRGQDREALFLVAGATGTRITSHHLRTICGGQTRSAGMPGHPLLRAEPVDAGPDLSAERIVDRDSCSIEADFDEIKTVSREGRRRPTTVRDHHPPSSPTLASPIDIR